MLFPQLGLKRFYKSDCFISRRDSDYYFRIFVRHGFVASDGRSRFFVKSDFGNDGRHAFDHLSGFSRARLDGGRPVFRHALSHRRHRLYRRVERRHDFAGFENRFLGRRNAVATANRDPRRRARVGAGSRLAAHLFERFAKRIIKRLSRPLLASECRRYRRQTFPRRRAIKSRKSRAENLPKRTQSTYRVWHNTDPKAGQVGKYLVDTRASPSISLTRESTALSKKTTKAKNLSAIDAPKATLMSYIIKGVLGQDLPWGLVIIGAMIAIVLE